MSDAKDLPHDLPHEGPIRTPKQLIWAVVLAFLVPIVLIILMAYFVASGDKPAAGTEALAAEATALRIQPVAMVTIRSMNDAASLRTGEQVYQGQCAACHGTGAAGAPKLDDAGAWGPRIGQGFEALVHSALAGKGAMGPQGGGDFSDFEISRAVAYMANHGGAKFDDPKPPAAASAAASAAE